MLAVLAALLLAVLVGVAVLSLVRAARALGLVVARETTPLDRVVEGPVEIAGRLFAVSPVVAPSGLEAACAYVRLLPVSKKGSKTSYGKTREQVLAGPAVLRDAVGNEVEIDLAEGRVSIQADARSSGLVDIGEVPEALRMLAADESPTHADVEEHVVAQGAPVVVLGHAFEVEARPDGYRGRKARFLVSAPEGGALLVYLGDERAALQRSRRVVGAMAVAVAAMLFVLFSALQALADARW